EYRLGMASTKMYWQQAGYPLVGSIHNAIRNLTEGTYLYTIAPITHARNIYYLQDQARLYGKHSAAEKEEIAEFFAFKSVSLDGSVAKTKGIKGWFNRLLGRTEDTITSKIEKQIRQVLWEEMGGGYSYGIVYRNALIDRLQTNQTANKYTQETEKILIEARRQAIQEFIETHGEAFEVFNKDRNFIKIYQQKIEDGIAKSSLPQNVRTIVLNNVALSFENSNILHVPVYNLQNHLIGTVAVERPEGMRIKEDQKVYIVSQAGSKKGVMYFWEGNSGKNTQTEIRSDIPLEVVGRQVRTSAFGLKKVGEGLLMINNRIWPMFGLYLLAGMGNVTTVIATFAKESFVMSNMEMYLMGGVSSVAMGIVSLFAGVWQNKWSFTKSGGYNERRGRLITTNIGLFSAVLAFVLPWVAGGMGGLLGEAFLYKKYLLISSFLLLGVSGAFLDVSMKPTLMAVSNRGEYQTRLGTLSVFKQTVGNVSNYIVPPIAMGVAMMIGTHWDWTIFFPIYTVGSIAIAGMYNLFKMHEQTLAETEVTSPKEALSFTKMFKELTGKKQYNKLIRRGVLATAFHGANMSIFGMYVNNLMKDHFSAFNMTDLYGEEVTIEEMFSMMSNSWLGHSMLYFTVPIIVGRMLGTRLMKQDNNFMGLRIRKMNGGNLLKLSIAGVGLGILLLNMPNWYLQVAGVVTLALGLTNVSPIIGGYTTDNTRHVSDAVSALLSGSSLISFAISTVFGLTLDLFAAGSTAFVWAPFIIPTFLSLYLFGFGQAMSKGTLETKEVIEENVKKEVYQQYKPDFSSVKRKVKKKRKRK
ncbi:MAG: MFS transporter, partial [Elusimicrobiaceae bacterium]|nr:MFS transporter [Elusimicrobiaceae bacterium]